MTDIIVFEGEDEVIICKSDCVAKVVKDFFIDTGRELNEFEVSLIKGKEALHISTRIVVDKNQSENFDVMSMLPLSLRTKFTEE